MGVVTVFKKIGHGVKVAVKYIARGFVALFGEDSAKQFAQASYQLLKSAAGKIAMDVVDQLSVTNLDSGAKREAAVARILQECVAQSIEVAESEVRLLVELAVQFVKGKLVVQEA